MLRREMLYAASTRARTQKKSREGAALPASLVMTSTRKAVRQSPIIVRLGADSVNFRQQIYKFLVNVALKPQTAKPPGVDTDGFAFSPINAFGAAFSGGVELGLCQPKSDPDSIRPCAVAFEGCERGRHSKAPQRPS